MPEDSKDNILVMAILMVTREDVMNCVREMGVPEEKITEDVIALAKEQATKGLRECREMIKDRVKEAIRCPLGMACSASCPWQEVGGCTLARWVK